MAIDIKVPSVGESVTEGTLSRWFKKDGDVVRTDEPLYELETEKATTEIAAPAAGTLDIQVREGETVAIGAVVGRLEETAAAARTGRAEKPSPAAEKPKPRGEDGAAARPTPAPAKREEAEREKAEVVL